MSGLAFVLAVLATGCPPGAPPGHIVVDPLVEPEERVVALAPFAPRQLDLVRDAHNVAQLAARPLAAKIGREHVIGPSELGHLGTGRVVIVPPSITRDTDQASVGIMLAALIARKIEQDGGAKSVVGPARMQSRLRPGMKLDDHFVLAREFDGDVLLHSKISPVSQTPAEAKVRRAILSGELHVFGLDGSGSSAKQPFASILWRFTFPESPAERKSARFRKMDPAACRGLALRSAAERLADWFLLGGGMRREDFVARARSLGAQLLVVGQLSELSQVHDRLAQTRQGNIGMRLQVLDISGEQPTDASKLINWYFVFPEVPEHRYDARYVAMSTDEFRVEVLRFAAERVAGLFFRHFRPKTSGEIKVPRATPDAPR
jgi:hypothetical protein